MIKSCSSVCLTLNSCLIPWKLQGSWQTARLEPILSNWQVGNESQNLENGWVHICMCITSVIFPPSVFFLESAHRVKEWGLHDSFFFKREMLLVFAIFLPEFPLKGKLSSNPQIYYLISRDHKELFEGSVKHLLRRQISIQGRGREPKCTCMWCPL